MCRAFDWVLIWLLCSGTCELCNDGASHAPNITLGCAVVLFFGLLAAAGYSARGCLKDMALVISDLYRVGKIKLSLIMYTFQVRALVIWILPPHPYLRHFDSD